MKTLWILLLVSDAVCHAAALGRRAPPKQQTDWHQYIRSPQTSIVKPQSILAANTTGNVTNPDGILGNNGSPTILTRKEGDAVPSLIVDFGQNVVGVVSMAFAGSSNSTEGFPGLKLAFSETQQFLTDVCDFTRSDNLPEVCCPAYGSGIWRLTSRLQGSKITHGTDQVFAIECKVCDNTHLFLDCRCEQPVHLERYNRLPIRQSSMLRRTAWFPICKDLAGRCPK